MKTPRSGQAGFVWLPVLLGILAVLLVSGGVYWYGHQTPAPQEPVSISTGSDLGNPEGHRTGSVITKGDLENTTGSPASVPGMSKYTDADFGFSFNYPSNLILNTKEDGFTSAGDVTLYVKSGQYYPYISFKVATDTTLCDKPLISGTGIAIPTQFQTNGNTFLYGEESDCGAGSCGRMQQYSIVKNNLCYRIQLSHYPINKGGDDNELVDVVKDVIGTMKFNAPTGSTVSVSGMSKYTDTNFGFSFWYPNSWTVAPVSFRDDGVLSGGTMQKMLQISGKDRLGDFSAQLIEYNSPNKIVKVVDGGAPMGNPHPATNYFFDSSIHTWMVQYPNGYPSERGDGSYIYPIGYTGAADVSVNTMGGLHILSANWFSLVPLSAQHFLASDMLSANLGPLIKTILATDPAVATPVGAAEQIKIIEAEKSAYATQ